MNILPRQTGTGTRRYVRALAASQGHHFNGISASIDGAEFLDMQADHDRISDLYFKRADDELDIALDMRDYRLIHNHIRASINLRAEGYRFESLEDDRREQAREALVEAHIANLAGSRVCDDALRRDSACSHGEAA